jgi:hypothetical protein
VAAGAGVVVGVAVGAVVDDSAGGAVELIAAAEDALSWALRLELDGSAVAGAVGTGSPRAGLVGAAVAAAWLATAAGAAAVTDGGAATTGMGGGGSVSVTIGAEASAPASAPTAELPGVADTRDRPPLGALSE